MTAEVGVIIGVVVVDAIVLTLAHIFCRPLIKDPDQEYKELERRLIMRALK